MSRKSLAILVSCAMVMSSIATSASAQSAPARQDQTVVAAASSDNAKNVSPLPAGGAAGFQEAQGIDTRQALIIGGLLVAGILLVVLLSNNNNKSTPSTP